ncbi:NAD(P)-binding protein [Gloeopeniophorella convolvens]|nr:NAD(P)-binding protein [Gloeopeniophorella convolvens]
MASFENSRVWLITGTNSGFGRALLEEVLAAGERAVATVRNTASLQDLSAKYPPEQLLVQQLDVTDTAQIAAVFKATEAHFHRLDVVVNNAGYAIVSEIEDTPEDEARRQIETLFWGPVQITRQAIRFFREVNPPGHGGRVLNMSSIGGYSATPSLAFYAAGKFALEGFTESLTREMPPAWNIKGIILEPGGFRTNWGTASMVRLPRHPAYDDASPSARFRKMLDGGYPEIGDVHKAARAMMRIAGEADPPLRLPLGSDAYGVAELTRQRAQAELEKWAEISHGTNLDGYGAEEVLRNLKATLEEPAA